ncbi:MAG: hypothetical protein AAGJ46_11350 [Planctomycetota bacterium]
MPQTPDPSHAGMPCWKSLAAASALTAAIYAVLAFLSAYHTLDTPKQYRPILLVVALYLLAFGPYWWAWKAAARAGWRRSLVVWVIGTSVLWRAILLPTPPFQEIDLYRYAWDGAVVVAGVDPYRFPPKEIVDEINAQRAGLIDRVEGDRGRLVSLATSESPEYEKILRTIHFSELPSPYPPVSQAVFAWVAATSPLASVSGQLFWLKLGLVVFDVATLLVLLWLLRLTGLGPGHAVAYGWCPLVVKEIANSGHLDSIAVFFATAAVALAVRGLRAKPTGDLRWVGGSGAVLGLGVGAKLFPIVIAPVLAIVWWRRSGWRAAVVGGAAILVTAAATLAPMLLRGDSPPETPAATGETVMLPPPPDADLQSETTRDKTAGLAAFLSRWEINDLLFAAVAENLRPQDHRPPERTPWFAVTPDSVSGAIVGGWRDALSAVVPAAATLDDRAAAFLLARAITLVACGAIVLACGWRASRPGADAQALPRAAFFALAWFWLLAPTQNPWYWCWAAPLLPFARQRAWAVLAACAMLYYVRFWLTYHCPSPGVFGTRYDGDYFFYFVVPWIEFGPWLLLLAGETAWRSRTIKPRASASAADV